MDGNYNEINLLARRRTPYRPEVRMGYRLMLSQASGCSVTQVSHNGPKIMRKLRVVSWNIGTMTGKSLEIEHEHEIQHERQQVEIS